MKVYPGQDERLEPPEEGWGSLWHSDGRRSIVAGARIVQDVKGIEQVKFYLKPYEETIRKFHIDIKNDLDRFGFVWKPYPKDMTIPLNTYDPLRKIFFSLLDWNGNKTESTDWFIGKAQLDEKRRLKEENTKLKSELAVLKIENTLLKEDIDEYIVKNFDRLLKPLAPFIRGLIISEGEKTHQ